MKPEEIESLSFEIIEKEAGSHSFSFKEWKIVARMIHTTADFDYLKTVRFHPEAIDTGIDAILKGKKIITDTKMAKYGINKTGLEKYRSDANCFISDPVVAKKAASEGITRARAAVDFAIPFMESGIYVVGNAPTALIRLIELVKENMAKPSLIIGLPVGFVNAAESKELLMELDTPYITNIGRKGGSNVAASVVNGLIILAEKYHG